MSTNTAFFVVMILCAFFIVGGFVWKENAAVWIGIGIAAFAIIGTLISDARKK